MDNSNTDSSIKTLGICLPMYGAVAPEFVINFINRLHDLYACNKYNVNIYFKVCTTIDLARNELVQDAIKGGCDYILFLDSDIIMHKGDIDKLVDMNVDIASGLYFAKGKPYLPVARVMKGDKHFFLEDFEYNKIIDVAGVGMGLCLIKADIFKNIEYPYFKLDWVKDDNGVHQIAEDLYFCDKARAAGYFVKLNTGVLLEHHSIAVNASHFNLYKEQVALDKSDREELFEDLADFEKVPIDEIRRRFAYKQELRNEEFSKVDKSDKNSVNDYYINNNYEMYDHFFWHLEGRRSFDKKLVEDIKRSYPEKVTEIFDFGCGGGQTAYMLAKEGYQVTVTDKNKKSLDFIKFRCIRHKVKIKIVPYPIHEQFKNKYDIVMCFDVLEHVPDEEFDGVINKLKDLKNEKGQIMATVSFGAENAHPSHFDMTDEKKNLIMSLV
jgi:2-polyprenyl-3-methyl-5-hydroxy-6-metoxy-1,4-benzoquinol methylase